MGQREVVFGIQPVLEQRIDMVHIELTFVENQVDLFVTDEAMAVLLLVEPLFRLFVFVVVQTG